MLSEKLGIIVRRLLWLGVILIGVGYFGPWVWHKAAGLILSADDLGEWIKFLPAWRAGQLVVARELFYLPIWLTAVGLGLLAAPSRSRWWKAAVLFLAILLVLTPLPKYPELLSAYREPEFVPTFWATVLALIATVGLGLFGSRLPDRVVAALWILIGVSAALFAPWMFGRAMPDIERLYHYSIGWGLLVEILGGVLLAVVGVIALVRSRPSQLKAA